MNNNISVATYLTINMSAISENCREFKSLEVLHWKSLLKGFEDVEYYNKNIVNEYTDRISYSLNKLPDIMYNYIYGCINNHSNKFVKDLMEMLIDSFIKGILMNETKDISNNNILARLHIIYNQTQFNDIITDIMEINIININRDIKKYLNYCTEYIPIEYKQEFIKIYSNAIMKGFNIIRKNHSHLFIDKVMISDKIQEDIIIDEYEYVSDNEEWIVIEDKFEDICI